MKLITSLLVQFSTRYMTYDLFSALYVYRCGKFVVKVTCLFTFVASLCIKFALMRTKCFPDLLTVESLVQERPRTQRKLSSIWPMCLDKPNLEITRTG